MPIIKSDTYSKLKKPTSMEKTCLGGISNE